MIDNITYAKLARDERLKLERLTKGKHILLKMKIAAKALPSRLIRSIYVKFFKDQPLAVRFFHKAKIYKLYKFIFGLN